MGEAYICRRGGVSQGGGGGGGATPSGITVITAPAKTSYIAGDTIDTTGMVIGANYGTYIVPITADAYTCAPARALLSTDTAITVTAVIGGATLSASVPITVAAVSGSFGDNPWNVIADMAAQGLAASIWNVGDSKVEDGITYTIIGMNHDSLSSTDAKYSDTTYNGNSKKAALTIQVMTPAGPEQMNETETNEGGWDECYMRGTIMPAYMNAMPSALSAVLRTVDKKTSEGGAAPDSLTTSNDKVFLLAASETEAIEAGRIVLTAEAAANPVYAYYANGGARYKGEPEWTRSPYLPSNQYQEPDTRFVCRHGENGFRNGHADDTHCYYPAFCI